MKFFGVSRASASCIGVALFVWAQAAGFCQNFGERPQMVVTKSDAYLIGRAQMLAPANADFLPNPQGRYALIMQRGAAAMPAPLLGKPETGALSLLLYDSHLNQTRQIFQRRADGGTHRIYKAWWLPQTDDVLVVVHDAKSTPPTNAAPDDSAATEDENASGALLTQTNSPQNHTYTLLLFDFDKNLPPRVLATTSDGNGINVRVSPIKPFFMVEIAHAANADGVAQNVPAAVSQGNEIVDERLPTMNLVWEVRMGSAPHGVLGPARLLPNNTNFAGWSASGTSIYEVQSTVTKAAPGEKSRSKESWYEWDGQSTRATPSQPEKAVLAELPEPQMPPVALRNRSLLAPPAQKPTPPQDNLPSAKKRKWKDPEIILYPLYLEAVETPTSDSAPDHSALIAPDAPTAALLADQSAVLYQSGGAVYMVPITHLNGAANVRLQKTLAQQKAKTIGKAILMYTQDYDDVFPLQNNFADIVNPYLKNEEALKNFTYTNPNVPLGSVKFPATTIMGYLTAPGGRVVVYVDGHVQWQNTL